MKTGKGFLCKATLLALLVMFLPVSALQVRAQAEPSVSYHVHCQTHGWMKWVKDGAMAGTQGESKRLEAIEIGLDIPEEMGLTGGIEYEVHCQTYGWMDPVKDGAMAGTTGESKRLEAIRIRLTGRIAEQYDVVYRVHSQTFGTLDWVKNGQDAGTTGLSKRLESIEIKLVKKDGSGDTSGENAETGNGEGQEPGSDEGQEPGSGEGQEPGSGEGQNPGSSEPQEPGDGDPSEEVTTPDPSLPSTGIVNYCAHVQSIGWQAPVSDGAQAGTTGRSLRMEAMKIWLTNPKNSEGKVISGGIEYETHVQRYGWMGTVRDGALAGTEGESKRMEALRIRLTGDMAKYYDVWYRTHIQSVGWLDWAKNGAESGSQGLARRMETIEIRVLPKGSAAPGSTARPFIDRMKYRGVIVIDPGHQQTGSSAREPIGPGSGTTKARVASGTQGVATGVPEYKLTLEVSLKLRTELEKRGYYVVMTRTTNNVNISNAERAQLANSYNADVLIRVHANGNDNHSIHGALTICQTAANPYTHQYAASSKLSQIVLDSFCRETGARKEDVWKTDTMTGINWAEVPNTIVEMGYMSNAAEDRLMQTADYQAKMVRGMANGIDTYMGY